MEDIREVRRKIEDFIDSNQLQDFLHSVSFNCIDDYDPEDHENVNEFVMDIPSVIDWHTYGSTKFVFTIPEVEDWVFKIPFKGCKYYHWVNGPDIYIPSRRYKEEYYVYNYCEREYELYLKAFDLGLEEFFAATFYLITIAGVDIYCSQDVYKLDTIPNAEVGINRKMFDVSSAMLDERKEGFTSAKPIAHLLEHCPQSTVTLLLDFLEKYHINDLYRDNYFYTKDSIVIVDYSGYSE